MAVTGHKAKEHIEKSRREEVIKRLKEKRAALEKKIKLMQFNAKKHADDELLKSKYELYTVSYQLKEVELEEKLELLEEEHAESKKSNYDKVLVFGAMTLGLVSSVLTGGIAPLIVASAAGVLNLLVIPLKLSIEKTKSGKQYSSSKKRLIYTTIGANAARRMAFLTTPVLQLGMAVSVLAPPVAIAAAGVGFVASGISFATAIMTYKNKPKTAAIADLTGTGLNLLSSTLLLGGAIASVAAIAGGIALLSNPVTLPLAAGIFVAAAAVKGIPKIRKWWKTRKKKSELKKQITIARKLKEHYQSKYKSTHPGLDIEEKNKNAHGLEEQVQNDIAISPPSPKEKELLEHAKETLSISDNQTSLTETIRTPRQIEAASKRALYRKTHSLTLENNNLPNMSWEDIKKSTLEHLNKMNKSLPDKTKFKMVSSTNPNEIKIESCCNVTMYSARETSSGLQQFFVFNPTEMPISFLIDMQHTLADSNTSVSISDVKDPVLLIAVISGLNKNNIKYSLDSNLNHIIDDFIHKNFAIESKEELEKMKDIILANKDFEPDEYSHTPAHIFAAKLKSELSNKYKLDVKLAKDTEYKQHSPGAPKAGA